MRQSESKAIKGLLKKVNPPRPKKPREELLKAPATAQMNQVYKAGQEDHAYQGSRVRNPKRRVCSPTGGIRCPCQQVYNSLPASGGRGPFSCSRADTGEPGIDGLRVLPFSTGSRLWSAGLSCGSSAPWRVLKHPEMGPRCSLHFRCCPILPLASDADPKGFSEVMMIQAFRIPSLAQRRRRCAPLESP